MLKNFFRLLVGLFFIYALVYPFIDTSPSAVDEKTKQSKPVVKKREKPRHNVKLPNFAGFKNVKEKKRAFFDFIRPEIEAQNKKILKQRATLEIALLMTQYDEPLNAHQTQQVKSILNSYKLPKTISELALKRALLRVDIIPKELALIQAAKESAWGTSRFAQIGLNFFGQWCYTKGCGMVPNRREQGADHEVTVFKSVQAAVASYFKNINTHAAYKNLRAIRADLRRQQQPIKATQLSAGLHAYSQRGGAYVNELNQMINHNRDYFDE